MKVGGKSSPWRACAVFNESGGSQLEGSSTHSGKNKEREEAAKQCLEYYSSNNRAIRHSSHKGGSCGGRTLETFKSGVPGKRTVLKHGNDPRRCPKEKTMRKYRQMVVTYP